MITWLCKAVNEYRLETMSDVEEFHKKMQNKASNEGYALTSFSWTEKFIKEKGEVVDSYFVVKTTLFFNDAKEPDKPFMDAAYYTPEAPAEEESTDVWAVDEEEEDEGF